MTEKRSKMPINSQYEEAVKDQKILTSTALAESAFAPLASKQCEEERRDILIDLLMCI